MSYQQDIRQGRESCRGVNLGGWLVIEHWITWGSQLWKDIPHDVADLGEFAVMKHLGHEAGDARFHAHRSKWIQEDDIKELKQFGLNTVRVPAGYWILGYDPVDVSHMQEYAVFAPNALYFLDLLINTWAPKYELAVLVDIHAAKGSQNGQEHSAPTTPGKSYWGDYPENVQNTVHVAQFIAARYRFSQAFLGIGLLNEPSYPIQLQTLCDYYTEAYKSIRAQGNDCIIVVSPMLSEQNPPHFEDFMTAKAGYHNVWVEWHPYFIWGYEHCDAKAIFQAIKKLHGCIQSWKGNKLLIGEWSLGTPANFPTNDRSALRKFAAAQLKAYQNVNSVAGWTFWTYKHSSDADSKLCGWSMRQLLRERIIQL